MPGDTPILTDLSGSRLADDDLQRLFRLGITELEDVVGEISPIFARTRLRFVFATGNPVLQQSSYPATFVPEDGVVYFGSCTRWSHENRGLIFCGHEIGHWLDHLAGPTVAQSEKLQDETLEDVPVAQSLASFLQTQQMLKGETSIIEQGVAWMNQSRNFPVRFQTSVLAYLSEPSEVFARFFEQWIACELYQQGTCKPVLFYPFPTYIRSPGYWDLDSWEQIRKPVADLLETAIGRIIRRSRDSFLRYQQQWNRHYETVRSITALVNVDGLPIER